MKIIWIHHRLLESSFSPVNKNWGYQALILPWSSAKSLMWILTFSMTWDVLWKRVATTWDVLAARWRKMAWVICWPGKWGETKKGTPKRGACDEHLKVKSCWAEDILPARWWWKTRNRSLMMFRLSLLGNSSQVVPDWSKTRLSADLGFSSIQVCWKLENYHPDKRMFAMVPLQELERQVQDRLQMAGCSADLKFYTLALLLELRPNWARMGCLACKLDR